MNRKFLVPLIAVFGAVTVFASCMKTEDIPTCQGLSLDQERHTIDSFASDNGLNSTGQWVTDQNFFANLSNPAEGNVPTAGDSISVAVKITLLNGTEIVKDTLRNQDRSTSVPFSSISQNQNSPDYYAISRLKQGGQMMIIFPSIYQGYAYGCMGAKDQSGVQVVPPNAQLIYTYNLFKLTKQSSGN